MASSTSSRQNYSYSESSFNMGHPKSAASSFSKLSNRSSVLSMSHPSNLKRKKQKMLKEVGLGREAVYSVSDPTNKDIDRTPIPLVKDTVPQPSVVERGSVRESIGSYTASGQVSPSSMSEMSDMERFSAASWGIPLSSSRTGSSTPSTSYLSDDEVFFFNRGISLNESMASISTDSMSVRDSKEIIEQVKFEEGAENEEEESVGPRISQQEIEEWLEQDFVIDLKETPTFFLFEHYDEAVPSQAEYLEEVRETNKRFEEAVKRKQTYRDLFTSKEVQTLNKFYKNKFSSTVKTETEDAEVMIAGWEFPDEW